MIKVYQLLAHGRWFSLGIPATSTTKTGRYNIAKILLKVVLNKKKKICNGQHSSGLPLISPDCIFTEIVKYYTFSPSKDPPSYDATFSLQKSGTTVNVQFLQISMVIKSFQWTDGIS